MAIVSLSLDEYVSGIYKYDKQCFIWCQCIWIINQITVNDVSEDALIICSKSA